MREKKHVNLRCIIFICAFMLTGIYGISSSLFLTTPVYAKTKEDSKEEKKEQFVMDTKARIGNYVRHNDDAEVVTTVTNNEGDFSGYIQIVMLNEDRVRNIMYQTELELAAGETKTIEQQLRWSSSSNRIMVRITDKKGNVISKKRAKVAVMDWSDCLIGILTDDKQKLGYWDGGKIAYLKKEDITSSYAMGVLDVLIINDFNTGDFEKQQYEAIKEWVELGGTLVLGTGEQVNRTLAMFQDDYLTGRIGDAKNGVADISFKDAKVIDDYIDGVVLHKIDKGLGVICVADKDLGIDKSLWNKKGYEYVNAIQLQYSTALKERLDGNSHVMYSHSYYDRFSQSILKGANEVPSVKNFTMVLCIYIIVVTFGVYIVLKKKDKLEWTWGVVPIVGIIFAGIIIAMGSKTRINGTYMNYTKRIEFQEEDNPAVNNVTYLGIASSSNSGYEIKIPEGMDVYANVNAMYNDDSIDNSAYDDYHIGFKEKDGQKVVELKDNVAFQTTDLMSEDVETINGKYQSDICYTNAKITGTFTNQTDMSIKNAVLMAEGKIYKLGNIKAGEKIEINDKTPSSNYTVYRYGQDEELYDIVGVDSDRDNWTLEEARYMKAVEDFLSDYTDSGIKNNMVYGHVDASDEDMEEKWGIDCFGVCLVNFPIHVKYIAEDGNIYVPDVLRDGQVTYGNYDPTDHSREPSEEMVIEYTLEKNEQLSKISFSKLLNPSIDKKAVDFFGSIYKGEIKAYNWKTKEYETIFQADKEGEVTDVKDYVGKENKVRFHIGADNTTDDWMYAPVISITKEVKQNG